MRHTAPADNLNHERTRECGSVSWRVEQLTKDVFVGLNTSRIPATGEIPSHLINVKDIEDGEIVDIDNLTHIELAKDFLRNQNHQILCVDDVLVTIRGTLLKSAIVRETHVGCVAAAGIAILRPNGNLRPELLVAAFRSTGLQDRVRRMAVGTTLQGLHIRTIKEIAILVPPQDDQNRLAKLFSLSEQQHALEIKLARMRRNLSLSLVTAALGVSDTI
jgi:hypothetical protein